MIPLLASVARASADPELIQGTAERTGWISASSSYSSSYTEDNAFNGTALSTDKYDAWISNNRAWPVSTPEWLQPDFQAEVAIHSLRMSTRGDGAQNQYPKQISVLVSNSSDMSGATEVVSNVIIPQPAGYAEWGDWVEIASPVAGQYLRVEIYDQQLVPGGSSGDWVAVQEVEFTGVWS
jgi:hypothetical protein